MDVVSKEGPLFLQGVRFGKKIWRKSWLILFESSPTGIGRMELYDMRDGGGRMGFAVMKPAGLRKMDKRVILLTDCLSITPAPGESCPTDCSAFFLNTTSSTYTIAAPTQEDWVSALCQLAFQKTQGAKDGSKGQKDKHSLLADNELYSTWGAGQFQVAVQSTEASQRCRMSGSYLLSAEKEAICLLDLKTGQAIYRWPYRLLRRFSQVKGGIMIESGRRCHTGEGQFIFMSKQGSQIHRAIEEAIMHQSVQELLAQATALPQEFASQPPSPNSQAKDRPQVKKLPPIKVTQERPHPALQCKHRQPIHKAIKEVLAQQSLQELLPPSTPPPPPLASHKPKANKHLPVNKERPCPPAPPIHRSLDSQKLQGPLASSKPPQQAPPMPPPLPKNKPNAPKHATTNVPPNRPSPVISRRHISLPDPPPCAKSTVRSPDDVLYTVIFPQPKPRTNISLPRVPTPPDLPQHSDTHASDSLGAEVMLQREKSDEEARYANWTGKTAEIEDLYSQVNFAAKRKNRQTEEQPNAELQTTSSEIPVDFKQTLSGILCKELSRNPHACPPRSHGGSCDQLDSLDEPMAH